MGVVKRRQGGHGPLNVKKERIKKFLEEREHRKS